MEAPGALAAPRHRYSPTVVNMGRGYQPRSRAGRIAVYVFVAVIWIVLIYALIFRP